MPHIWTTTQAEPESEDSGEWRVIALEAEALALDSGVPVAQPQQAASSSAASVGSGPTLLRTHDTGGEAWAVVGSDEVHINGVPMFAGMAMLRDRDEVRVRTADGKLIRLFFSTEQLARIEAFPGSEQEVRCPRCRRPLTKGAPVVRCGSCGVYHDQSDDRPCWTYAPRCTLCDQETSLDGGYRWSPSLL